MNPRILLVEDDPVSRAYLQAALQSLPASVDAADCCASALQLGSGNPAHALWLVDANLPDGDGAGLLSRLRAAHPSTPALAHTASHDAAVHAALRGAGFLGVLVKPIGIVDLHAALRRLLPAVNGVASPLPDWDDAGALRALKGEQAHVVALRRLFLDELPAECRTVQQAIAIGDTDHAARTLHRLRASCGFVGAAQLADAVQALERDPRHAAALQAFTRAADALLASPR